MTVSLDSEDEEPPRGSGGLEGRASLAWHWLHELAEEGQARTTAPTCCHQICLEMP